MPSSASIKQAGPWCTAATVEVRDDGYLMEDIRSLARSGRNIATAATFSHPRIVNLLEYTEANATASTHGITATALYEEPVSIATPMTRPGAPPPPRNAWTRTWPSGTPIVGQTHMSQDPTTSPSPPTRTRLIHSTPREVKTDTKREVPRPLNPPFTPIKETRSFRGTLHRHRSQLPQP
jgi:hypothetical protein